MSVGETHQRLFRFLNRMAGSHFDRVSKFMSSATQSARAPMQNSDTRDQYRNGEPSGVATTWWCSVDPVQ